MYGKHHTDEAKKKMSESHMGKPTWNKGIPLTEECKMKKSIAMTGKHWRKENGVRVWY